jgi:hypothetical protein
MLLQEGQPDLDALGVSVPDLDESSQRHSLKVLLALLEDETTLRDSPALGDTRQRNGAESRQTEVVGRTQSEVAKELEVWYAVGTELDIACRDAILVLAAKRFEVESLNGSRETNGVRVGIALKGIYFWPFGRGQWACLFWRSSGESYCRRIGGGSPLKPTSSGLVFCLLL